MHNESYGLREIPFNMAPDLRYIFRTENYIEVLESLRYCVEYGKGLIVVTGEVGTGKTTTLRLAMKELGERASSFCFFNPSLSVQEFFEQFCYEFGLEHPISKPELLTRLNSLLLQRSARGELTVLILDEAHSAAEELLEEVRLLLNFEANGRKLLQVILCGHPELREKLSRQALRQLKQRIAAHCELNHLTPYEVEKYIRFRLKVAGARRVDLFEKEAIALVSRVSGGLPRMINNICDNALRYGSLRREPRISRALIEETVERLGIEDTAQSEMSWLRGQQKEGADGHQRF